MRKVIYVLLFAVLMVSAIGYSAEPQPVAHWKLDDTSGDTVLDSSGKNHGKTVGQPGRAAGKLGRALTFNGKDTYIEIPNSKDLEKIQEGSYSIAVWFKPEIVPPGTERTANDLEFGIVIKTGWHTGLSYNHSKQFIMGHWLKGDTEDMWYGTGTWESEFEPGQWYHIVGVVDQRERVVKIFVNGELKGNTDSWSDGAKPRDYGQQTWKIGVAGPGNDQFAWFAKGAIDDVRIYNESLTDDQVTALYKMPPPAAGR